MGKQVDVIAAALYVCNILYVAFHGGGAVLMAFTCKDLEADVEDLFLIQNAIIHAVLHITLQILFQPVIEGFPVFRKYMLQVYVDIDVLWLFGTHDIGVAGIAESSCVGLILPAADEGGFLNLVEFPIVSFQFQLLLAAFRDVTILA